MGYSPNKSNSPLNLNLNMNLNIDKYTCGQNVHCFCRYDYTPLIFHSYIH